MKATEHIPAEQLRPFIKSYRVIESEEELLNRILPDTSFALAFRFRGQISYINNTGRSSLPGVTISGLRKSVRLINYAPASAAIIVQFKETGVSAFFKQPLYELFEESISLDSFFPRSEILTIEERLAQAVDNHQRIAVVEQYLCSKLSFYKTDGLVLNAITKIYSNNGVIRIKDLANELYISLDAFEKRFRKITGATPKHFAYIVRMNNIIVREREIGKKGNCSFRQP